jgi:hypothetical protein
VNTSPSWKGNAWSHWHRPWAIMHSAWQAARTDGPEADVRTDDWVLRLHYPAWCEQHGLEPFIRDFEENAWWHLLGLTAAPFDQAVCRVGLVLMFAADPRTRLQRRGADDPLLVRWALGRTPLVPESVATAIRKAQLPPLASPHAALSLQWCLVDTPDLLARLRLRFNPDDLQATEMPGLALQPAVPAVPAWLGTLWAAAVRVASDGRRS